MRRVRHLIILVLFLAALPACTTMVPRKDLPYPLTNEQFGDPVKVVSIPLPVIATNPNEGVTAGALGAFLLHNAQDEVSTLLAPQVNYNDNFGTTFSLFGAFFPSPFRNWEVNLSHSTTINYDYGLKLRDTTLLDGMLESSVFLYGFADGSARFYGFQSTSLKKDETNYTDEEYGITLSFAYPLGENVHVVLGERFRTVSIRKGAVTSLPSTGDYYTEYRVPGLNGFTAHAQKLGIVYSTLDARDMPTRGVVAKASIEASAELLGSSAGYRHYEVELKGYLPVDNARYISVGRLAYNQTLGSDVPFLERSILGGETTLRGYGRNRFIDSSYLLCNLEERIRLFRWSIFDVNTDWELAPFIDLGAVMESLDRINAQSFEFNPGFGFRAVVRPNIVGRIDVGFGKEGPAVFVGLGYPF